MTKLTSTKFFIDGGDPQETSEATRLLKEAGFDAPDGQTTNPSLVAKNPDIADRIEKGDKLTEDELLSKYKTIVREIEKSAPGDISIEVYADKNTAAEDMVRQAREFGAWIDSAVIKLPITAAGLQAANELKDELKLNMTLCFSQEQAAAVYAATSGARKTVYVSPFIGRLDDRQIDGMSLIANILRMYKEGDGHVEVLAASLRHLDHILETLRLGTNAMTLPFVKAFKPWAESGFKLPDADFKYVFEGEKLEYKEMNLSGDWTKFNIQHDLTDTGLQKFADDWNNLLVK